jgi:glycosyltransferase involved in cell wall biosynthesis
VTPRTFADPIEATAQESQISVVIPVYNSWPRVRNAIRSAFAQTYQPREIIVVDDGSIDGSAAHIQNEFGDRVRCHIQENRGPASARNAGVRLSSGGWIAFLDSDDEWTPDKLAAQAAQMRYDAVKLVACEAVVRDEHGKEIGRRTLPRPFNRKTVAQQLRMRTTIPMGVLVDRSVLVELGGFDESLFCGEDRELWARIVSKYEIAAVYGPRLIVTDREGGVSRDSTRVLRDGLIVNRSVQRLFPSSGPLGPLVDAVLLRKADSNLHWSAAWLSAHSGRRRLALGYVLRSLWLYPWSGFRSKVGLTLGILLGRRI